MLVLSPCQPYAHYIHRSLSLAAMKLLSVFHDDCMTGSTRCKAAFATVPLQSFKRLTVNGPDQPNQLSHAQTCLG